MTLNKKVVNYKVLDPVILYNFDIKFDFIPDQMKKSYFLRGAICRDDRPCHHAHIKMHF